MVDTKKNKVSKKVLIPTREDVLKFLQSCLVPPRKREIAQALGIKGQEPRVQLKKILADLKSEGLYHKASSQEGGVRGIFRVKSVSSDGEISAFLHKTDQQNVRQYGDQLFQVQKTKKFPQLGQLTPGVLFYGETLGSDLVMPVRIVRPVENASPLLYGLVSRVEEEWIFLPASNQYKFPFRIGGGAFDLEKMVGHYAEAVLDPAKRGVVRLKQDLGPLKNISDFVLARYDVPMLFSDEALAIANGAIVPSAEGREDIRDLPLVTIDGVHAKDFDDAVWAEPDPSPQNKGGWHLIVAIADVAHYVPEGSSLDLEAYARGNSIYLPDKVIPMLPEALSNGVCSLRPDEDRACLGAHIWIDAQGQLKKHTFFRGLMRSHARLTYEQVAAFQEGQNGEFAPLIVKAIQNLNGAYASLLQAREARNPLEIHAPELTVDLDEAGEVCDLKNAPALTSHQLIEEFMVLANRAAAQTLKKAKLPIAHRFHDTPSNEKISEFKQFLRSYTLPTQGTFEEARDFNAIQTKTPDELKPMMQEMILRSQSKAVYDAHHSGHFGLHLEDYCHFTSPIRRYADLLVHRSLVRFLTNAERVESSPKRGAGLSLDEKCRHISERERVAISIERESKDRFATCFFQRKVGESFNGYVSGISRAGLFISLTDVNVSGLLPMESLGNDYFVEKQNPARLEGRRTGIVYGLGQPVEIVIQEADVAKGRLTFGLSQSGGDGKAREKRPFKRMASGSKKPYKKPSPKTSHRSKHASQKKRSSSKK